MLLKIEDEIYLKRGQDRNFNIKWNRKVVWSIFERKKKKTKQKFENLKLKFHFIWLPSKNRKKKKRIYNLHKEISIIKNEWNEI